VLIAEAYTEGKGKLKKCDTDLLYIILLDERTQRDKTFGRTANLAPVCGAILSLQGQEVPSYGRNYIK